MKKLICLLLCALMLCGCAQTQETVTPTEPTEAPTRPLVEVPMEIEESRLKYEGVQLTYWSLLAETAPEARVLTEAAVDFQRTTGATVDIHWQAGDEAAVIEGLGGGLQTLGAGLGGAGGIITISGGEVNALSDYGAGIGGGEEGDGGTITISSGEANAISYNGAGIGAGENGEDDGTLTVHPNMLMQAKTKQSDLWITVTDAKDYLELDYPIAWLKMLPISPANLPQTGDNSQIALWLALMMLTGTATLILKRKTA